MRSNREEEEYAILPSIGKLGVRYAAALDRADNAEEKGLSRPHLLDDSAPRNILAHVPFTGVDSEDRKYREVKECDNPELKYVLLERFRSMVAVDVSARVFEARVLGRNASRHAFNFPATGTYFKNKVRNSHMPKKPSRRKKNHAVIRHLQRTTQEQLVVIAVILPEMGRGRTRCWVLAINV
jgi:hypothetical protein